MKYICTSHCHKRTRKLTYLNYGQLILFSRVGANVVNEGQPFNVTLCILYLAAQVTFLLANLENACFAGYWLGDPKGRISFMNTFSLTLNCFFSR